MSARVGDAAGFVPPLAPLSHRDRAMFRLAEEVAVSLRVRPPLPEIVAESEFLSPKGTAALASNSPGGATAAAGSLSGKGGIKARRLALEAKAGSLQVEISAMEVRTFLVTIEHHSA